MVARNIMAEQPTIELLANHETNRAEPTAPLDSRWLNKSERRRPINCLMIDELGALNDSNLDDGEAAGGPGLVAIQLLSPPRSHTNSHSGWRPAARGERNPLY